MPAVRVENLRKEFNGRSLRRSRRGLTPALDGVIWPLLVIGAVSIRLGIAVFHRGELYAKRNGMLKRSG